MSDDHIAGRRESGNRAQRRAEAARSRSKPRSHHGIFYQGGDLNPAIARVATEQSAATEAVSDDDREWFAANPGRQFRLRLASTAEIAFHACHKFSGNPGPHTYTLVREVSPGARLRMPFKTHIVHRWEHYGENACEMLFRELEEEHPKIAQAIKATASLARRGA